MQQTWHQRTVFEHGQDVFLDRRGDRPKGMDEPLFIGADVARARRAQQFANRDPEVARDVIEFVQMKARRSLRPFGVGVQERRQPGRLFAAVLRQLGLRKPPIAEQLEEFRPDALGDGLPRHLRERYLTISRRAKAKPHANNYLP